MDQSDRASKIYFAIKTIVVILLLAGLWYADLQLYSLSSYGEISPIFRIFSVIITVMVLIIYFLSLRRTFFLKDIEKTDKINPIYGYISVILVTSICFVLFYIDASFNHGPFVSFLYAMIVPLVVVICFVLYNIGQRRKN